MGIPSKIVNGNYVYYHKRRDKWIDALGPTVRKYFDDFIVVPVGADNADPTGWTVTAITGDAGDGTLTAGVGGGGELIITTDDTENDGINIQHTGEQWLLATGDPLYFGTRLKVNTADGTDLIVGLALTDTGLWGGVTDGIYFESADATAVCTFVTEKDSTETSDTSAGTLVDNTYSVLEFFWDGVSRVNAYFDDVLVATSITNIPTDEELSFSIELLAGGSGADTVTIDWIRVIQCQ